MQVEENVKREDRYRNVDDLLTHYHHNRIAILNDLNPERVGNYVEADSECQLSLGHGIEHHMFSDFRCHNCTEIGRLFDYRKGPTQKIKLESGAFSGITLTLKRDENPLFKTGWDDGAILRSRKIEKSDPKISKCGLYNTIIQEKYLSSDNWLNGMLINWAVSEIFTPQNIPHYRTIIKGFVCGNDGYQLYFGNLNPLLGYGDQLDEEFVLSIIYQISSFLYTLQDYQFVHGTATIDKLFISPSPCNYKINSFDRKNLSEVEHIITHNKTLIVDGFHLSSINWNGTRIIPSTRGRGVDLKDVNNFIPDITSSMNKCNLREDLSLETCSYTNDSYIYQFNTSVSSLFTTMRYSGFPLFGGSFDTYSFLTSLATWKPARDVIDGSSKLRAIYGQVFPRNLLTGESILSEIPVSHDPVLCSYKIANILTGKWLYCNSIDRLINACHKYR